MRVLALVVLLALIPIAVCAEAKEDDWYGQAEFTVGMLQDLKTGEQEMYVSFPLGGYRLARVRGGFVVDLQELDLAPSAGVLGLTFHLGNAQDWGIDAGWAEYVSVSIGPFGKYEFESGDFSGGVMLSFLEVSFGGVEEQKKR